MATEYKSEVVVTKDYFTLMAELWYIRYEDLW